ncbi:DUF1376 domain-containing protein [Roseospira marina]|uniref:DUF1376 domain-containing protein n=1 Tax=Roseospira marina TaxID=140057 RepID=A0A5M6IBF1_9PROT|nr:YdaU family protein [Roseospira marina]KAA5605442.1 DUF1376 domain-containing protein [Roseospira marina]MBB4314562.1 uncharacterized protein YdaU (DUF1376 family) [Roseospira marina]MBB5088876.1 uncharacterized protein YdaU (DUF1376 family) [Roseospira marina]
MSAGRPWYKRYPADFIAATMHLKLEEKGAYSIVLDLLYDRGQPIPDDSPYIARVCGCSTRRWNQIRQTLLGDGKLYVTDDGGHLSNTRFDREGPENLEDGERRRANGSKGGKKRAKNRAKSSDINDIAPDGLETPDKAPESPAETRSPFFPEKNPREVQDKPAEKSEKSSDINALGSDQLQPSQSPEARVRESINITRSSPSRACAQREGPGDDDDPKPSDDPIERPKGRPVAQTDWPPQPSPETRAALALIEAAKAGLRAGGVGVNPAPAMGDLETAKRWQASGADAETVRCVAEAVSAWLHGKGRGPPASLAYLDNRLSEALASPEPLLIPAEPRGPRHDARHCTPRPASAHNAFVAGFARFAVGDPDG